MRLDVKLRSTSWPFRPDDSVLVVVCCSPDRFAFRVGVLESHLLQLAAPVKLIMARVGLLSEVLHVYTNEHLPQLHKVTMVLVFH